LTENSSESSSANGIQSWFLWSVGRVENQTFETSWIVIIWI